MTAIAYRDGVLATDTATFQGNLIWTERPKIVCGGRRVIAAACGLQSAVERFHTWLRLSYGPGVTFDPRVKEDGDFTALIAEPDRVCRIDYDGATTEIDQPFVAIGAPYEFLIGAMAAGASARQAVALAIKHHSQCGGRVISARLPQQKRRR